MTDQIELPPVPQSPPIVTLAGFGGDESPGVILFDSSKHLELLVNLDIRDEDRTETLKMRWRVESNIRAPGTVDPSTGNPVKAYTCPEPEIPGDGELLIREAQLKVGGSNFARNTCNRVDVIVSASFKMCRPDRDDGWDITTQEDDDAHIGRESFLVWAFDGPSNDPRVSAAAALAVTQSCISEEFQPPSATAPTTSAAMGM